MYRFLFLIPILVVVLFPDSAAAQLVTCSGEGGITESGSIVGNPCGTCEFVSTVKNTLGFITLLASIIATITLVYVGLLLVTSGGSTEVKAKAKTALWNIVLGLFFIIAAFAIVDAVMRALVTDQSLLNWQKVDCLYAIQPTAEKVNLPKIMEFSSSIQCDRVAADQFDCSKKQKECTDSGGKASVDRSNPMYHEVICTRKVERGSVTSGGVGTAQCAEDNKNCSISELIALGLTEAQANVMSCVAVTENAGSAVGCSGTGPCGTFQISRTNWRTYSARVPGCTAADFGGSITNAQNNGVCNAKVMSLMVKASGYQPWTGCCDKTGKPWNTNARKCVQKYSVGDSTPRGW